MRLAKRELATFVKWPTTLENVRERLSNLIDALRNVLHPAPDVEVVSVVYEGEEILRIDSIDTKPLAVLVVRIEERDDPDTFIAASTASLCEWRWAPRPDGTAGLEVELFDLTKDVQYLVDFLVVR